MARNEKSRAAAPAAVDEDQARFAQLISSAADVTVEQGNSATPTTPPPAPVAAVGRIVHYRSKKGDGIVSPAIVLRTRQSTNPEVIERWGTKPDDTLSGASRPKELVAELPDDETVDLLVHGLGGDYREYAIPFAEDDTPGTWTWPPRA